MTSPKKKKIAIVMPPMVMGGAEKVLCNLLDFIDYETYTVDLWLRDLTGVLTPCVNPNVHIHQWDSFPVPKMRDMIREYLKRGKIFSLAQRVFYRICGKFLSSHHPRKHLYDLRSLPYWDDFSYDCAIAFQGLSPAVLQKAFREIHAKKHIAWIHGTPRRNIDEAQKRLYLKADKIFCVSQNTQKIFLETLTPYTKKLEPKTEIFYNIQNQKLILEKADEPLHFSMNHPSIVTVGRLSHEKGHILIPDTVKLLAENNYHVTWYIVGDGACKEAIEEKIRELHLENEIILLGNKQNPYPYIKMADIYVQPSFTEGYCTTTMEAKILHKPVVTTDVPGAREQFIDGVNGSITKEMTPQALYDSLKLLLDEPAIQKKYIDNLSNASDLDNTRELRKLYQLMGVSRNS